MDALLKSIKLKVFDVCGFKITNFATEIESKEYNACRFLLNSKQVLSRSSKITPKKIGQFVTFYKRNSAGIIAPFSEEDCVDFYLVNVQCHLQIGFFLFPKSILIKKGIITTATKEGKRAFRVYPPWDVPKSKQAMATQQWQSAYFYFLKDAPDKKRMVAMFG